MRILVPYTDIAAETREALNGTGWPWQAVPMDDDTSYWQMLARQWAAGRTFVIVEHDVIVHPLALDELSACEHDWCAFPHAYLGASHYGLGCVKFSAGLLARTPDALEVVGRMGDATHAPKHWCRLDGWLTQTLTTAGESMHHHPTVLGHTHRGPSHGCIPDPAGGWQ